MTPDDLINAPFEDDQEQAESEWLLARERDPAAPPPSPQVRAEYDTIERLLYELPERDRAPDDGWQERVLKAAAASRTGVGSADGRDGRDGLNIGGLPLAGGSIRRRRWEWPDYFSPGWIAFYLAGIAAWAVMLYFAGLTVCLEIVAGAVWLFIVLHSLTQ